MEKNTKNSINSFGYFNCFSRHQFPSNILRHCDYYLISGLKFNEWVHRGPALWPPQTLLKSNTFSKADSTPIAQHNTIFHQSDGRCFFRSQTWDFDSLNSFFISMINSVKIHTTLIFLSKLSFDFYLFLISLNKQFGWKRETKKADAIKGVVFLVQKLKIYLCARSKI